MRPYEEKEKEIEETGTGCRIYKNFPDGLLCRVYKEALEQSPGTAEIELANRAAEENNLSFGPYNGSGSGISGNPYVWERWAIVHELSEIDVLNSEFIKCVKYIESKAG